ncbi:MAG: pyridoxamine 5'-phosphate oxidase family protein [Propionibacteriales bacterium]|nr:pyridoxamine 5'-phosphate oxidase family protein [Propionibacteriales bacterium]
MTDRTRIRRLPEKALTDLTALHAVLDAAKVGHVAFVQDGYPVNIPVACARDGDRLLLHGSTGSRLFRALASGTEVCVTVTLLDGLVLARSAFESSMHYRSAMVFGIPTEVADKPAALQAMTEAWMPGRWAGLREPRPKELAATLVLELPLVEWSVKISAGDPDDPAEDLDEPVWAGVLPIVAAYGDPVPAPDLRGTPSVPEYLRTWTP